MAVSQSILQAGISLVVQNRGMLPGTSEKCVILLLILLSIGGKQTHYN